MGKIKRGFGRLTTAASSVHLVLLMKFASGIPENSTYRAEFPSFTSNRCSDFDLSGFADAMNCGPPLSAPCFDFSRCRDGPTVYVYDRQVRVWKAPSTLFVCRRNHIFVREIWLKLLRENLECTERILNVFLFMMSNQTVTVIPGASHNTTG